MVFILPDISPCFSVIQLHALDILFIVATILQHSMGAAEPGVSSHILPPSQLGLQRGKHRLVQRLVCYIQEFMGVSLPVEQLPLLSEVVLLQGGVPWERRARPGPHKNILQESV